MQVWMCMLLGISIIVLVVPGLFAVRVENYRPFFTHGASGFLASLPPLFFAYAGFESLAQTAAETRDSTRRLPRIFLRGIIATTIIYLLMSIVALGVLSGEDLRRSAAPMADAAARYLPLGTSAIVTLGAIMAAATSLNATMLVPSRMAIMLADDGLAPRWIGRVSERTATPIIGLTFTLLAALTLLVTGRIGLALSISVFALIILYFLHSLALLLLPWRNPELYRSVTVGIPLWVQRVMAAVSMVTIAILIVQMARDRHTVVLAAFWGAIGVILYVMKIIRRRPET
jgi:amino acid transporter